MLDGIAMGLNYNALDSFKFETFVRDVTEDRAASGKDLVSFNSVQFFEHR